MLSFQKQLSSATTLLQELPLFKHLNYSRLASIAYTMRSQTYSSGSVIVKQGISNSHFNFTFILTQMNYYR